MLSKINQRLDIPWLNLAITLQVLDLVTFLPAVIVYGIGGESNFLMAWVHGVSGDLGVIVFKLIAIAYFIVVAKTLKTLDSALLPVSLGIIGTIGALGVLTNVMAIWLAL